MNSHYPKYYGEKKPPTNDQDPNPVTFLTVTNTTFVFALAPRHLDDKQHQQDVDAAKKWLQDALQTYGTGGKTSAGYGYFKDISNELNKPAVLKQDTVSAQRIRPNIPTFREGQDMTGSVLSPTDELRRYAPTNTKAFLRYQSFASKDVLIVVTAEEAQNWKPGETRNCLFEREEVSDGCTVLVCRPKPSKKKK